MNYHFILEGDHYQFYIEDEQCHVDTSHIWENDTKSLGVVSAHGLIGITTARFGGTLPVTLEVYSTCPQIEYELWERVVQCSIEVLSGSLVIWSPENDWSTAPRIMLEKRTYSILVCFDKVNSIQDEFAFTGEDTYHLMFWPGIYMPPTLIYKRL